MDGTGHLLHSVYTRRPWDRNGPREFLPLPWARAKNGEHSGPLDGPATLRLIADRRRSRRLQAGGPQAAASGPPLAAAP